jgi:glycosyltransferase involved in cell wall biosynthesis
VIVNSDGGSTDGTQELVASVNAATPRAILVRHPLTTAHKIITPYHGLPGKGSAFRTIFAIAKRLGVRACAVVDSDLRSISPAWIELCSARWFTRASTTWRRSTCGTSTTARSRTRSSTR